MDIDGHDKYRIYDDGRVWSKKRGGRWLKPCKDSSGYHQVYLSDNGKKKTLTIHRLVALHYIPNPENKQYVDHKDRNRTNNHVSNLRWVTAQENSDNTGMYITNKSGHQNISYCKYHNNWRFLYQKRGHHKCKYFKTKQDALVFKFCFLLMLNKNEC